MDAAAADPKVDVTNSKETRKFLRQSVGFENDLISQSMSPIGHGRDIPSQLTNLFISPASAPWRLGIGLGIYPGACLLRGGICRQRPCLRKAESRANPRVRRHHLRP
jgi:hypothetical protein